MKRPLVSICIPTYNRCEQLKKTLDSIVCQDEFLSKKVEVIISDNASSDDTQIIGQEYADKYENIYYYRNDKNIRDENFPLVISRANGILRKLNNDTLVMEKDALTFFCSLSEKYSDNKPCIFLSNGRYGGLADNNMNFHDFTVKEGYQVTWIGAFTIWDDECKNIAEDIAGCELLLWQVRKFYENAFKKNDVIICDFKFGYTEAVTKKNISYGLYKVFYENYFKLLSPYIDNNTISINDVEDIKKDLLYNFFTGWIINWEINNSKFQYSNTENLKEAVWNCYRNKTYWNKYLIYYKIRYIKVKYLSYIKKFVKTIFGRI